EVVDEPGQHVPGSGGVDVHRVVVVVVGVVVAGQEPSSVSTSGGRPTPDTTGPSSGSPCTPGASESTACGTRPGGQVGPVVVVVRGVVVGVVVGAAVSTGTCAVVVAT